MARKSLKNQETPDPASNEALLALPSEMAGPPDVPVAIAVLELRALARLADKRRAELAEIGVTREMIATLSRYAERLRRLDRDARGPKIPRGQRKKPHQAGALRDEMLAAARWALRRDPSALAELSGVRAGAQPHDTIHDLLLLARFWDARTADLGRTRLAPADVARARKLASDLETSLNGQALDEHGEATALRNRCFWAAEALAREIREGGRYAFHASPKIAARFGSAYAPAPQPRAGAHQADARGALGPR
jgi:hypothetical protein